LREALQKINMGVQIQNVALLIVVCFASAAGSQVHPDPIDLVPTPLKNYVIGFEKAENIGFGLLPSPEDLALDREKRSFFTGCGDGWIKRVWIDGKGDKQRVENWAFVGGRPLGVALGPNQELIVCELTQGLLNVTKGKVEVLCSEAGGSKFKGIDGVDVSKDGVIYFTDATLGMLIKYNPSTRNSTVLLTDLDYPNGVALSAQEDFLVICETYSRRCPKYWLKGKKSGKVETYAEKLPAYPDNVRLDEEGTFWIGLLGTLTTGRDFMAKYRRLGNTLRSVSGIINPLKTKAIFGPAGILGMKDNAQVIAFFSDSQRTLISGGLKVGDSLYFVSLNESFINRLELL
ncbi:hypothetical protein KI387_033054, partial [Taxus chinensis]